MGQVFTDYVRSLKPSGEPPDRATFDKLWRSLSRALRHEITSRGLWESPPSFLGIYGWSSWSQGGPTDPEAGSPGGEGALEELLAECYRYIFVERLGNLLVHLRNKPSIDGLVFLNIRNLLYELQKQHDPLGFRVFEILHPAVERLVDAEELQILGGDARIRNDTVLGFGTEPKANSLAGTRIEALAGLVGRWNDALLPDLVVGRGRARERVIATLQSFLLGMHEEGVDKFQFKELIDSLKNDVRTRWAAQLDLDQGESVVVGPDARDEKPHVVRLIRPDGGVEERDALDKLRACMAEALDRLEAPAHTRRYLGRLWEYLSVYAADLDEDVPSHRRLAEILHIPRNRMSELYYTLGGLLEDCRNATFPQGAVNPVSEITDCPKNSRARPPQGRSLRRPAADSPEEAHEPTAKPLGGLETADR